jgi:phosphohistidine phosphatase SixA
VENGVIDNLLIVGQCQSTTDCTRDPSCRELSTGGIRRAKSIRDYFGTPLFDEILTSPATASLETAAIVAGVRNDDQYIEQRLDLMLSHQSNLVRRIQDIQSPITLYQLVNKHGTLDPELRDLVCENIEHIRNALYRTSGNVLIVCDELLAAGITYQLLRDNKPLSDDCILSALSVEITPGIFFELSVESSEVAILVGDIAIDIDDGKDEY